MKNFTIVNATTVDEAVTALGQPKASVLAGGTDLLGMLKGFVSPNEAPDTLVNIKTIPNMEYIKEEGAMLKIGALTKLVDIAESSVVQGNYAALAEAAHAVATPELRNVGTIAGNICQHVRCWYYRQEYNAFYCLRKDPTSGVCDALIGDNRYHSIFGAVDGCVAVNQSDIAPALVALDASIVTSSRTIGIEDFFAKNGEKTMALDDNEVITEIQIPTPAAGTKSAFAKFAIRKSFDFPIVNCAIARAGSSGRICLNAVYNLPRRATDAESALPDAEAAGTAAVNGSSALPHNSYKIQITKMLVKGVVEATA